MTAIFLQKLAKTKVNEERRALNFNCAINLFHKIRFKVQGETTVIPREVSS